MQNQLFQATEQAAECLTFLSFAIYVQFLVSHQIIFLDSQTKFVQLTTDYVIYTRPSGITSQPSPAADANVT